MRNLRNLNIDKPAIPPRGIYTRERKSAYGRVIFTAAHFTTAKIGNQPKCRSPEDWRKKLRAMYTTHTYTDRRGEERPSFWNSPAYMFSTWEQGDHSTLEPNRPWGRAINQLLPLEDLLSYTGDKRAKKKARKVLWKLQARGVGQWNQIFNPKIIHAFFLQYFSTSPGLQIYTRHRFYLRRNF